VLEDSARNEAMLERNGSFHVRPAMVNRASHRQQPVVDRSGLGVILRLPGGDELDERLGCETAVPHQRAVHVEHRVQQILVMAGEDLQVRTLTPDDRNLRIPPAHIAHAVLHGEHAGQRRDIELGLEVVGRLGRVRILKQDQRQSAFLVDRAIAVLRRSFLVAEPQPAVRGIDQPGLRPGLHRPLCLQRGDLGAFQGDAGDDGEILSVDRLDEAFDDRGLLVGREKRPFAGMTENNQAFDAFETAEPGAEPLDRRVVDLPVVGERGHGGGNETC